ncbi:hypothetical protein BG618_02807 [Pseudonocardia autotrophica]|nr:hypothetical protein BG618_02807 [Pseudonocardia autotrophica]
MSEGPATTRGGTRVPKALIVAVAAWLALGVLELVVGFGSGAPAESAPDVDRLRDELGSPAVSGGGPSLTAVLTVGVAALTMAGAFVLLARRGWARIPLAALGVAGVVLVGLSGRAEAVIGLVLLVLGVLGLMTVGTHRYLRG